MSAAVRPAVAGFTSLGPASVSSVAAEERRKAEDARSVDTRLAALPRQVQQWRECLDIISLEAMASVVKDYEGNAMQPVDVHASVVAQRVGVRKADAEAAIERLLAAGALAPKHRFAAPTHYVPVTRAAASSEERLKAEAMGRRLGEGAMRQATKASPPAPAAKVDDAGALPIELARGLFGLRGRIA